MNTICQFLMNLNYIKLEKRIKNLNELELKKMELYNLDSHKKANKSL